MVGPLLPEAFRQTVSDVLLAPLADGYMGLLKTFSGIMILVAVCSGIFGMGNQEALVRTGRSVTLRIAAISIAVCIGTMGLVQPFVHLQFNQGMQGSTEQVKAVSKMIFDILPSDPVEPFRIGNYIQIIIIALFIGTGLLAIGERGARIRSLIEDSDALMQQIILTVSTFIPMFVFAILLRQIWLGEAEMLVSVWKPVVLINLSYIAVSVMLQ